MVLGGFCHGVGFYSKARRRVSRDIRGMIRWCRFSSNWNSFFLSFSFFFGKEDRERGIDTYLSSPWEEGGGKWDSKKCRNIGVLPAGRILVTSQIGGTKISRVCDANNAVYIFMQPVLIFL